MASKLLKIRTPKRRSSAGRPPKEGAERFPSGQIKPEWTEKQAKSVAIEARQRVHQVANCNGEKEEAGYTAGRMCLDGKITEAQLKAGNEYAEMMVRYYRSVGYAMPSARAQSFGQVRGHDGEETDDQHTKARNAANEMIRVEGLLLQCTSGPQVKSTIYNLFVMDMEALRLMSLRQLGWLRCGLDALIRDQDLRVNGKSHNKLIIS